MAYRDIPHEIKVKAVQEYLKHGNLEEVIEKYGISESTLRRGKNRVISQVPSIIPGGPIDDLKKKLQKLRSRLLRR